MPRVKRGFKRQRRHKKLLKLAEGYYGSRHRLYKTAREAVDHALSYAYAHRKDKKRDFRRLWQTRISAVLKEKGSSYSKFIHQLKTKNVGLNRKMLSELAISQPEDFGKLIEQVQAA